MKNAIRMSGLARIRWRAEGMSDPFSLGLSRRTDRHHSIQVVGQNAEPHPRIRTIAPPQATVSPRIFATAQADRRFLPTAPALMSSEPPLTFVRRSFRPRSSFIGQADPLDPGRDERMRNLHEQRLSELLYNAAHRRASRDAFILNCPNCHCGRDSRIQKHAPSRRRYDGSGALRA